MDNNTTLLIRPYIDADKSVLIDILRLNTPMYFAKSEEVDFIEYLDKYLENYFVAEINGQIVGCGGINYFKKEKLARISWDIIHPNFQGKGIGKRLTLFRINEIKKNQDIHLIVVRTTQLVFEFYQKMGFQLKKIEKDFWEKGFDLYQMEMGI